VALSATQQFSVLNLPSCANVVWSVSPAVGNVSTAGLYSAPTCVATQQTLTITATNSATQSILGTAGVTLQASPSVSPTTATVAPSATQQFSVLNLPSGANVAWSVSPAVGNISTAGLYAAPTSVATQQTLTITATNSATQSILGTANVTLQASRTMSTS
jgi:hypothetical protein